MQNKATRIHWFNFTMPQMRAFHMTWVAFSLCFIGWFGIAPLTSVIQKDLHLTDGQIANSIIASVAIISSVISQCEPVIRTMCLSTSTIALATVRAWP